MNPKVDFYFTKAKKWKDEISQLRKIILDCGLTEELKWGVPCYTYATTLASTKSKKSNEGTNIVLIHVFKEYCALLFFKGALLNDPNKILIQQTKNVQSARQIRFTNVQEIVELEPVIKAYIYEAIEIEKLGLKLPIRGKQNTELELPEEFQKKLNKTPSLKTAFNALTPGRQRGYSLFFSAPKQSKTRESRIEKSIPQILKGKGLNDE